MSTKVQHRRGDNSEINNNVPAVGEIWYNTDTKALHVGDGSSKGGKVSLTDESIWGDRYVGAFASGFTYTSNTDVARGQDGKYYRYIGNDSYPVVVSAGTVASDFDLIYQSEAGGVLDDTFVVVNDTLSQRTINKGLESIVDLSTINNPKDGLRVYVKSYHVGLGKGGGYFVYNASRSSENDYGHCVNGWIRQNIKEFNVCDFGAKGDGVTNDTDAMFRASLAFNKVGVGKFVVPPSTDWYVVGKQEFGKQGEGNTPPEDHPLITYPCYANAYKIIWLRPSGDLFLDMTGAKLRFADGMYAGGFNLDGTPTPPQTNMNVSTKADMGYIVYVSSIAKNDTQSESTINILGGETFGNDFNAVKGGWYGDTGYQMRAYGLYVVTNSHLTINNHYAHHFALDGIYTGANYLSSGQGKELSSRIRVLKNCTSEFSGRNNFSPTGGSGFILDSCKLNYQGCSAFSSSPNSGADMEYETGSVFEVQFRGCEFKGNRVNSILMAWNENLKSITYTDCVFESSNQYPDSENLVYILMGVATFKNCQFYNTPISAATSYYNYGDRSIYEKSRFIDCYFTNKLRGNVRATIERPLFLNTSANYSVTLIDSLVEIVDPIQTVSYDIFPRFAIGSRFRILGTGGFTFAINNAINTNPPYRFYPENCTIEYNGTLVNKKTNLNLFYLGRDCDLILSGLYKSDSINNDISNKTRYSQSDSSIVLGTVFGSTKANSIFLKGMIVKPSQQSNLTDYFECLTTGSTGSISLVASTTLDSNIVTLTSGGTNVEVGYYVSIAGSIDAARVMYKVNNTLYLSKSATATVSGAALTNVQPTFKRYYKPISTTISVTATTINAGETNTRVMSFTNASIGDVVEVSMPTYATDIRVWGTVTANNQVTIFMQNYGLTASTVNANTTNIVLRKQPTDL